MSIEPGQSLAQYRVVDALGEGGMGEVWRAEDSKLGRAVALKVLPDEFARDPDRMARFEREAKVLASLNHPNIATLYGLETTLVIPSEAAGRIEGSPEAGESSSSQRAPGNSGGPSTSASPGDASAQDDRIAVTFLAMELVEGEDLSERIKRGAVPVDEAVAISLQIAEALEAAHEQGVVHRDLKPANIKVRPDGTVKVLDFGLAKAWDADSADSGLSLSPTMTAHATAAGLILGTAAYMSPEQARGMSVDRRADIWSFGVVLWEMLTGRKLFEGHTMSDVLASVLKEAPDLQALPADTPPHVHRLIGRCLDKDANRRLRDIGEARVALEGPGEEITAIDGAVEQHSTGQRRWFPWVSAGLATVAALVLAVLLIGREAPEEGVIRFETPPPEGGRFHLAPDNPGPVAVSPDGRMITYSGRTTDGVIQLWVRPLDEAAARPLAGTENAQYPFWSPDSRRIGFFARGKLRVVEAVGGPPLALCDATDGKGGSWSRDGVIIFAPNYNSPLHSVVEAGGESTPITEFDVERKDNSHRHPRFLPDGQHFLYVARSASGAADEGQSIVISSLDGSQDRVLMRAPTAVEYASGHILFIRDRTLLARPFDADKLEFSGDAFPIAEAVTLLAPGTVVGVFSASQSGVLAYQVGRGQDDSFRLVWRDREGNELGTVGEPGSYDEVHIIPGGELAAVALEETASGNGDIWVIDLRRNLFTKFSFDPGYESGVTPSPDGKTLFFTADNSGEYSLVKKEIGGSGEGEVILESTLELYPTSVSPNSEFLSFFKGGDETNYDIWILPLSGDAEAYPFIETEFVEVYGMFSPDGRWLAYMSNESGSPEIYVTAFPEPGRKWQISINGGQSPRWNENGSEILYHASDGMITAVRVDAREGGLLIGEATPLFNTRLQPYGNYFWALSPDGERVLAMETGSEHDAPNLSVVVNWLDSVR
jgi:serine/threonine protein kinase/Tol biopolymer transport system component